MSETAVLEIVELNDGEIVLRHAEGEGEPLLRINFSEEAGELLRQSRFEVAREMIDHAITRSKLWQEESDEPEVPATMH
ncbi:MULTISPECIES: hypothetical protein [Halomonadaceae]|uniref:hypothetical protein n=1 Tax=Halomonadaceae TaxID=28256 RepID=UPI00158196FE|nr:MULTISPECIES: hypothetical protein [Halomonas]MDI4639026.1 hypothetical protein [Halomonas sp. BMC7]NUJ60016.1 hypothetical protein [Halomonas taeanensis]